MRHSERGNILFLILLAVILFAALSYAVTSSMKGGGNDASGESLTAQATSIIHFMEQTDTAVLRMMMTKSIKPENISFRYDARRYGTDAVISNYMNNGNCTDNSCRVFQPEGGGANYQSFEKLATTDPTGFVSGTDLKPGHMVLQTMQWPYAGTDATDIVMNVYALKPAVCAEINRQLGVAAQPNFTGSAVQANVPANWDTSTRVVNANANQVIGKRTFAGPTSGSGDGQYCHVYRLLITR